MIGRADGSIIIAVDVDTGRAEKGFSKVKGRMLDLSSVASKVGKMIASAFAIREIVQFGKECIELGSNVAEVQNVVDTAFGDMAYKIEAFSDTAIKQFGMSELAAKKTASTYMAMARGMGIQEAAAADMALTLTGLTGDIASFFNISQELADIKLKSVFTGETETLKDLGIVMTETNLEAFALSKGIKKSFQNMSQSEKVALRYNFVMEQLSLVHGDFAKTSDSWANQTRILSMQWQEFMSIIGQTLTTVFKPLISMLNTVVSSLIDVANTVNSVVTNIFGGANTQIQKTQSNVGEISGAIGESVENQNALTEATKETAKAQAGVLAGFDEVNKLGSEAVDSGGISAGAVVGTELDTTQIAESTTEVEGILSGVLTAIQPAIDSIMRLWDALKKVGKFAGAGLKDFYGTALKPIGEWVIGEGFPRFVDAISNGLSLVDWQHINDALHTLWEALAPFAVNVGEGLLWLWENVLVPFGTWVVSDIVPVFIEGIAAALDLFNAIWDKAKPGLEWFWVNFLQPVAEWTGGVIVDTLERLVEILGDFAGVISGEITFKEFIEGLDNSDIAFLSLVIAAGAVAAALAVYNTAMALAAILTGATVSPILLVVAAVASLIAAILLCIKNWDKIKEVAKKCLDKIIDLWETVGDWFNDHVVEPVSRVFENLWDSISGWASDAWDGIKNTFSEVSGWFNEKVIQPVTAGFKDFVNGLIGFVESFVNFFVRGINTVIDSANKLKFEVPDWVPGIGGETFGLNLKRASEISLPRLATGAVVPPNREFMAILGDNKQETEVVSPLSTMKQAVLEALQEAGGFGGGTVTVVVNLDGKEVARNTVKHVNDMTRQAGKPVLLF